MAKFTGVMSVRGGGKFFGEIEIIDAALEAAMGLTHADGVNISGVRGAFSESAVNVSIQPTACCPWDAVDMTVPLA